jgi:hypothetical protein
MDPRLMQKFQGCNAQHHSKSDMMSIAQASQ